MSGDESTTRREVKSYQRCHFRLQCHFTEGAGSLRITSSLTGIGTSSRVDSLVRVPGRLLVGLFGTVHTVDTTCGLSAYPSIILLPHTIRHHYLAKGYRLMFDADQGGHI